ncbi:glutaredoxin domain-containing protein [Massilia sp. DWR3-1-1]|uniref:glutaredoxin domain-containing protein n=1 Tax=Massilia sp. DWR3-1-1 TaxID=2804559 RepID=UPI003CEE53E1
MTRAILDDEHIHPLARATIDTYESAVVGEVRQAIATHAVVIVGMAQNPYPRKARRALDAIGAPYHYLEYGSYFSQWRPRGALKMWTGWPTYPMVFVKGTLVGGAAELQTLITSGEFERLVKV